MTHRIGVIRGDGTGPEVVAEGKVRFGGRLPCRRQVRKMGWPTE